MFGVTNDRRVEGVTNVELVRDFGSRIRDHLSPSVDFRSAHHPHTLSNARLVYVLRVPRSPRGPHAVYLNGAWTFLKRTAAGSNEPMTYEEIRLAFQDTETRRTKLALLSSELSHLDWVAERLLREIQENASTDGVVNDWAWMTRYPTTVIDTILGDAYSLFADKTDLAAVLTVLRPCASSSRARSA